MDYILWMLALGAGFALGYAMAPKQVSEDTERLASDIDRLKEDIAYYKKLTKNLVEENKQLRAQRESN